MSKMMGGRRSHEHGMPGSKNHDAHIGGMGDTHMSHAMDHLRATKSSHGYQSGTGKDLGVNNKELDRTVESE